MDEELFGSEVISDELEIHKKETFEEVFQSYVGYALTNGYTFDEILEFDWLSDYDNQIDW